MNFYRGCINALILVLPFWIIVCLILWYFLDSRRWSWAAGIKHKHPPAGKIHIDPPPCRASPIDRFV